MSIADLIIRGGRVLDPANEVDCIADVVVKDGKIVAVSSQGSDVGARQVYDATGCIVTPGLIDMHVHCYQFCTALGVNPDANCLARGVTTIVDAGSSGASTFPGLREFIMKRSACRVLAFLHIADHGLAAAGCAADGVGGESDSLNTLRVDKCAKAVSRNRDVLVGVKVRLTTNVCNNDPNTEMQAYRLAKQAAAQAAVPLMVHHAFSSVPVQANGGEELSCPGSLLPGDIYTHTFHGFPSCIVDPKTMCVYQDVVEARRRGVVFDVGHGQGSFSWDVLEKCTTQGFWPDVISSDLHSGNVAGPAYDLPLIMSKFLHVGMPLSEVVRAVTSRPARVIGRSDLIGSLTPGLGADITVLQLKKNVNVSIEDSNAERRDLDTVIEPVAVFRDGVSHCISLPQLKQNVVTDDNQAKMNDLLVLQGSK